MVQVLIIVYIFVFTSVCDPSVQNREETESTRSILDVHVGLGSNHVCFVPLMRCCRSCLEDLGGPCTLSGARSRTPWVGPPPEYIGTEFEMI